MSICLTVLGANAQFYSYLVRQQHQWKDEKWFSRHVEFRGSSATCVTSNRQHIGLISNEETTVANKTNTKNSRLCWGQKGNCRITTPDSSKRQRQKHEQSIHKSFCEVWGNFPHFLTKCLLNFPVYFVAWLLFSSTSPPIHSHGSIFQRQKSTFSTCNTFLFSWRWRQEELSISTIVSVNCHRSIQKKRRSIWCTDAAARAWFSVVCLVRDCNDSQQWKTVAAC